MLASDCILCADSSKAMGAAARKIGITHRAVNLAAGIRVVARGYHVQNVNAYDSRLKNWMHRFMAWQHVTCPAISAGDAF